MGEEGDEIRKRRTDCVYFLASPLTCKKGGECEYRHCETARLNPTDCWYWLNGTCLNPSCGFRHPPIEVPTEKSSQKVPELLSAATTGRINAPCYFYFSGYCTKGEKCRFSHGNESYSPLKVSSARKDCYTSHEQEKKSFAGSTTVSPSLETPQVSFRKLVNESVKENNSSNVVVHAPENPVPVKAMTVSPQSSVPQFDLSPNESDKPASAVVHVFVNAMPDQSTEELREDYVCSEDHLESSPGFDVLVDHDSENLGFEGDSDYRHIQDGEPELFHNHLAKYSYEESDGYGHFDYSDVGYLRRRGSHDPYCHFDRAYDEDYTHLFPEPSTDDNSDHSSQRMLRCHPSRGEMLVKHNEAERPARQDVHHRLQRETRMEHPHAFNDSRRHRYPKSRDYGRERTRRRLNRLHTFSSDERNVSDSYYESRVVDRNTRHDTAKYANLNRPISSRLRRKPTVAFKRRERQGRKHALFPESAETLDVNRTSSSSTSVDFSGPKTLAQIKEEKERDEQRKLDSKHQYTKSKFYVDFQGPKPLKELLEKKRKLDGW